LFGCQCFVEGLDGGFGGALRRRGGVDLRLGEERHARRGDGRRAHGLEEIAAAKVFLAGAHRGDHLVRLPSASPFVAKRANGGSALPWRARACQRSTRQRRTPAGSWELSRK